MARLFVVYPAAGETPFDRDYFVGTHLPLVETLWGPIGLTSARGYFPGGDDVKHVAVAVLEFRDEEALAASLASDATAKVMGDVPNYTAITPVISRGLAL